MPSTATPSSNTPGSTSGAPSSYTEAGPPDRTTPAGRRAAISDAVRSCGTISEYTWHSRIRRAISCAYCAPRSTTSTGRSGAGRSGASGTTLVAHPHVLGGLVRLALGLDRRRDHELRLLELSDRGVPGGGHRRGERAEQVERAVVLVSGADQDLLQRRDLPGLDPGAPRERGMERRHPPVIPATRGLVGPGQR